MPYSTSPMEISDPAALVHEPLVSVLMLAYNHAPYLGKAIEGVLAQSASIPLELIIGEDCSNDGTLEIAKAHQHERPDVIRIITSDANVGSQANWRRVLQRCRGKFIAHNDGDDYWLPEKLEKEVAFLLAHEECTAVYTNALVIKEDGTPAGLFNDAGEACFSIGSLLRRGNFLNHSSMIYRSEFRDAILAMKDPFIDYQIHLQLATSGFIAQLSRPLTVYRASAQGSAIATMNHHVRELYWQAIMSVPRDLVSDMDFALGIADFGRRVGFRALRQRQMDLVREWAPRIFAASPFGKLRTSLLIAGAVTRMMWKELYGKVKPGPFGCGVKVLYRR